MLAPLKRSWIYLVVAIFVALNILVLIPREIYAFTVVPVVIVFLYMLIYKPKQLLLLIVFFTPLSINIENLELGGIGFFLPTEPLLFGMMILYIITLLQGHRENSEFLRHPITIIVILSLIWTFITVLASSDFVVSIKNLTARLWFILVLYFMASRFFREQEFRSKYLWLYIVALIPVIFYTFFMYNYRGYSEDTAHWAMNPFYKDHTSYGAILAMYIPLVVTWTFGPEYKGRPLRWFLVFILLLFIVAIVLSYTRAAWLSLVAALGVFIVMKLRISFRFLLIVAIALGGIAYTFQNELMFALERNRQDSSGDIAEHIQSVTNVSTDASNLERINRWNSAFRMFAERPVFGFGPGTYMFQYATFQMSYDKTIISTNQGDGGNAHSEYLGPLAEQGILGLVFMLLLVGFVVYTGVRLYFELEIKSDKRLVMALLLGLITYFIHGFLNNFLDTDKASIPVWGFISILVALDLYAPKKKKNILLT